MSERRKLPRDEKPLSLRIPKPLMERIKAAAERLGIPVAEVVRTATGIGLEHLRRIDFDIDGAVIDASERLLGPTVPDAVPMAAEVPAAYAPKPQGRKPKGK